MSTALKAVPDMRRAALDYARRGLRVVPVYHPIFSASGAVRCSCKQGATCSSIGKHPRINEWQNEATTDEAIINKWFTKWPHANIGIATGAASGVVALDVDPKHEGDATLAELVASHGALPETRNARTGSDGAHILFKHPGVLMRNVQADKDGVTKLGKGLDIRGDGGQIVAAPSLHASGKRYEWQDADAPLAPMPKWLLDKLSDDHVSKPKKKATSDDASIIEGHRNTLLFQEGSRLRRYGASLEQIEVALLAMNARLCIPPLDEAEVLKISESAAKYQPAVFAALSNSQSTDEPRTFNLSDYGNAERFVHQHGVDVRYCHPMKKWLVYDGKRFVVDATAEVIRRAKATVRSMYAEAAFIEDQKERAAFLRFVLQSESAAQISAMLTSASSQREVVILPNRLDADPFLFNCANGTLDLATGELRAHSRDDLITKLSPVEYEPEATDEVWEKFLDDATGGNLEFRNFLQRACGYSLTGDTREEVFFFVHGSAATGKSTFVDANKAVLGEDEYAKTADFETFLARRQVGGTRNDLADLNGARFVSSIEVDEGKKLAEGIVKAFTGNDAIKARFLYQEHFTFRPAAKLWLVANHQPKINDDDDAIWRRILLVPFTRTVAKEKRDPRIKAHLRDVSKSGAAILAWMVKGCLAWQRDGLRVPQIVDDATEDYRLSQDPIRDFIEQCCVLNPSVWVTIGALRQEYEKFCKERGGNPATPNDFAARLKARGCTIDRRHAGRGWLGVGLLE